MANPFRYSLRFFRCSSKMTIPARSGTAVKHRESNTDSIVIPPVIISLRQGDNLLECLILQIRSHFTSYYLHFIVPWYAFVTEKTICNLNNKWSLVLYNITFRRLFGVFIEKNWNTNYCFNFSFFIRTGLNSKNAGKHGACLRFKGSCGCAYHELVVAPLPIIFLL